MMSARSHRSVPRAGSAPIEFVMFLPVFIAFILVLLWIARVQHVALTTSLETEMRAADEAIHLVEEGNLPATESFSLTQADQLDQLVNEFRDDVTIGQGIVSGMSDRDTGPGINGVVSAAGIVKDSERILAHAWESTIFEFADSPDELVPLTLPKSIPGIAPQFEPRHLSAFRSLLNFGGAEFSGAGELPEQLSNQATKAADQIRRAIERLDREIRELADQIRDLEGQADRDEATLADLKRQLNRKRSQLKMLTDALPRAQAAAN